MRSRCAVLLAVAVLLGTVSTAPPATAAHHAGGSCAMMMARSTTASVDPTQVCLPAPPKGKHWMGWREALRWANGNTVGVKSGTRGEQSQILGWTFQNRTTPHRRAHAIVDICEGSCGTGIITIRRNSWWNPFSWDWGSVMGKLWDKVFVACAKGLRQGLLSGAGLGMLTMMVTRGAVFELTPAGAALAVVGTCWAGIAGN